jgi:hypothetical protein
LQVKRATPGAVYYLGVNYQPLSLIGQRVNAPNPTVPYTFVTSINNTPIPSSTDSVLLKPR